MCAPSLSFSALLDAVGFPGERTLDSHEFQALAKWHEVLGELSRLERVVKVLSFSQAVHMLRKQCMETLFQPEGGGAPVQVLGILESAGLEFDCLWVGGLTDDAWPIDASPNPFLPLAAQKTIQSKAANAEIANISRHNENDSETTRESVCRNHRVGLRNHIHFFAP